MLSKQISIEVRNLYRALGELAYAFAMADKKLSNIERIVFQEAVKEELGKDSWLAKDRFDMIEQEGGRQTYDEIYHRVLYQIKQNHRALSDGLIERFILVLEKVAGVSGITDEEITRIENFKEDIYRIYSQNLVY